jgi:hypothetical protein
VPQRRREAERVLKSGLRDNTHRPSTPSALDWCREFLEAHSLQQAGLIRYSRGHITILNRDGLEDCACECYSTIRAETDKVMGAA